MVTCPQAVLLVHFTSANEIPDILLIPSSIVPNSPVRFLPCLTASRLGPQIPFVQVHARHTIYPFMKPLISPIHPPQPDSPMLHSSIHPSSHLSSCPFPLLYKVSSLQKVYLVFQLLSHGDRIFSLYTNHFIVITKLIELLIPEH